MKKLIVLFIMIINITLSKELVNIKIEYNEIRLRIMESNSKEEKIEFLGLLNGKEVMKEIYINGIFISAERYKYINNEKFLFYKRNEELDKNNEVIVVDEIVYYAPDKIQQRFFLYPKGFPINKQKGIFDSKIRFSSAYLDREEKMIDSEAGEYPVVSNVLFSPLFSSLAVSKEIRYLMDLKK